MIFLARQAGAYTYACQGLLLVYGRVHAAVQSMYNDAQIAINITGCIGGSPMLVSGETGLSIESNSVWGVH